MSTDYDDEEDVPILAKYSAKVKDYSMVDLDIKKIESMTKFDDPETWNVAKYIYMMDSNPQFYSLHSFVISGIHKSSIPFFNDFVEYFDHHMNFIMDVGKIILDYVT